MADQPDLEGEQMKSKVANTITTVITIVCFIVVQGCATMFQSGPDNIVVNSEPRGATVMLDDLEMGITPLTLAVPRNSDCIIRIEKDGYRPRIIDRDKHLAGWFFPGNLLWLLIWPAFPVAMVVDLASRNQGKYSTKPINVRMVRIASLEEEQIVHVETKPSAEQYVLEYSGPKKFLALIGLRTKGMQEEIGSIMEDLLRNRLAETGCFDVMEGSAMERIAAENEYDYADCHDRLCATEFGMVLGVSKVAYGSISSVGRKHIVHVTIVDVDSGTVKVSRSDEKIGDLEEVTELISNVSHQLAVSVCK